MTKGNRVIDGDLQKHPRGEGWGCGPQNPTVQCLRHHTESVMLLRGPVPLRSLDGATDLLRPFIILCMRCAQVGHSGGCCDAHIVRLVPRGPYSGMQSWYRVKRHMNVLFETFHLQRRRSLVPGTVDRQGRDGKA